MKNPILCLLTASLFLATGGGLQAAIHITAPSGGETFATGDRVNVTWEVTGDFVGPGVISLRNEDNPRQFFIIKRNVALRPATSTECTVPADVPDGRFRVVIRWGLLRMNSAESPVINIGSIEAEEEDTDPAEEPEAMADLVITGFELKPEVPVKGEPVGVKITVMNRGAARSAPYKVAWWPGENYPEPAKVWEIDGSNARGGRVLRFTYDGYPSRYPSHLLFSKAVADSDNTVAESDESNNQKRMGVEVVEP